MAEKLRILTQMRVEEESPSNYHTGHDLRGVGCVSGRFPSIPTNLRRSSTSGADTGDAGEMGLEEIV